MTTEELENKGPHYVVVTNFTMPFWSLVGFMVKLAIAAIPAAFCLAVIYAVVVAVVVTPLLHR